ncbi:MAG: hypothetical protein KBH82_09675 [Syntrophorhabdaceae bacterium]|nr:hypothetical protein [Syntrophorhabdaceae bacterium]
MLRKTEDRSQKSEVRRQKTEDRRGLEGWKVGGVAKNQRSEGIPPLHCFTCFTASLHS